MDKSLILNRIKEYKNFSSDIELAEFLGVSRQTLSNWRSRNSIDYELLFTKCEQDDLTWLITGRRDYSLLKNDNSNAQESTAVYKRRTDRVIPTIQQIPLYNIEAAAGVVHLFRNQNDDKPIDFIQIPGIPKSDGALYITGDSMYPLLKSGDIAIYKKVEDVRNVIFFWGEMYIIGIDNDGDEYVGVKFVQKSDLGSEYIKLVSHNQHHSAFDVPKDKIKALALVKASVRINSMG